MSDISENTYSLLFENNPDGCLLAEIERDRYRHPEGFSIVRVNMEYARLIGLARVTILEKGLYDVLPGGQYDWEDIVMRVTTNGRPVQGVSYWELTDRHLKVTLFLPRRDMLAVRIEDVSSKCLTSRTVSRHESQLDSIMRVAPELVCRFLPDGVLTYSNRAYREYYDKGKDKLIGHSFMDCIVERDVELVRSRLGLLNRDNQSIAYEYSIMKDGEERRLAWSDTALFDDRGVITEYQSIGRDISESYRIRAHREEVAGLMDDLLYYRARRCSVVERDAGEKGRFSQALSTDLEDLRREVEELRGKTISGELEICRECNRIHDEKGHWMLVPLFFESHTAAQVEHTICPYCRRKSERKMESKLKS